MKSIEDQAKELAKAHRDEDPDTSEIWWAPDPKKQEVRLVEVSGSVGRTGEVLPFRFAPQGREFPYPTVIVLLSPDEKEALFAGELELPESWGMQVTDLRALS